MKPVYFYIDESGKLAKDEGRFFIICCYITDNPERLKREMDSLYNEICNEGYYDINKFKRQGFHACQNHPDIRSVVYRKLYTLDFRQYMLIVDKESTAYNNLKGQIGESALYGFFISTLLRDRLLSERNNYINLIFEEYSSYSIENHKYNMSNIITNLSRIHRLDLQYSVEVHSKSDILLSIVDYCSYIMFQMLHETKDYNNMNDRWVRNFKLIEPKLAYIEVFGRNLRYSSTNNINFTEILDQVGENK